MNLKGICGVEDRRTGNILDLYPHISFPFFSSKSSPPPTGIIVEIKCHSLFFKEIIILVKYKISDNTKEYSIVDQKV